MTASSLCQAITRRMEAGFSQGTSWQGRTRHKGHYWNRWDSGRAQDSCPLDGGSQVVEQVCPPLSWRRPLENLLYSVIICIVSLLGVYPFLKEDDLLSKWFLAELNR